MSDHSDILSRALERERKSRKRAEQILEEKSAQLYRLSEELKVANQRLEDEVAAKTKNLGLAESRYQTIIERVSDIIFRCDENGLFTFVNGSGLKSVGFSPEDLLGQHFSQLVHPDYKERVIDFYAKQYENKTESTYYEFPILDRHNNSLWIGQTVNLHQLESGTWEYFAVARNITSRVETDMLIKKNEEKFRTVIETMKLGLLEVGLDDRITDTNTAFCQMSGYSRAELIGKKAIDTLLQEDHRNVMEKQNQNRAKGKSGLYEIQMTRKDGEPFWVLISGASLHDHYGNLTGSIGIHLDINHTKSMMQELADAKEKAEQAVVAREMFMANMSHEIRTPMNGIIGLTDLLVESPLSEGQLQYAHSIQNSSRNLLAIINDILDFSKIQMGKLELDYLPCDVEQTIHDALDPLKVVAENKGLEFTLHVEPGLGKYRLEPTRLSQVLINLVGNAIKFTHEGKVTVECRKIKEYGSVHRFHFSVEDTGVGIPEDKIELIFESFAQADKSTSRKYGGTGLGLSISKNLVEMLGGTLYVRSSPAAGSLFSFDLLLNIETQQELKTPEDKDVLFEFENRKILVVDDHEINRLLMEELLKKYHCNLRLASTGEEAIQCVLEETFDLIFMDMRMPGLDGIQTTRHMRNRLHVDVPIIGLTANASKEDELLCLANGMNAYMPKPFKRDELLKLMRDLMDQTLSQSIVPGSFEEESISNREEQNSLIDFTKLREISNNDEGFMNRMISIFIEDTPSQISHIRKSLTEDRHDLVKSTLHKMKPSIDFLSIQELGIMLRSIEESKPLNPQEVNDLLEQFERLLKELKASQI